MSSASKELEVRMADENEHNRILTYASYHIDLGNGLQKEIRFSCDLTWCYVTTYLYNYIPHEQVQKLADDMMLARIQYLQNILDGYVVARGKADHVFAFSLINEYLLSRKDEFEYRNFSGQNKWADPKPLFPIEPPRLVVSVRQSDVKFNKIPESDWLFSHKLYSTEEMGYIEGFFKSKEQRFIFGKTLEQPPAWNFDEFIEELRENRGKATRVAEHTESKNEMLCAFLGCVSKSLYREFRVRYTSEMMNFEVKDITALVEKVRDLIIKQLQETDDKDLWTSVLTGLNIDNAKYLYAMFMQGSDAILRFEMENISDDNHKWNMPQPLTSFLRFFNNTLHYETTVPAPEVPKIDPYLTEANEKFLNEFNNRSQGDPESIQAFFNTVPLTEADLYPELSAAAAAAKNDASKIDNQNVSDSTDKVTRDASSSPENGVQEAHKHLVSNDATNGSGGQSSTVEENGTNGNSILSILTSAGKCENESEEKVHIPDNGDLKNEEPKPVLSYAKVVEKTSKAQVSPAANRASPEKAKPSPVDQSAQPSPAGSTVGSDKVDSKKSQPENVKEDESEWKTVGPKSNRNRSQNRKTNGTSYRHDKLSNKSSTESNKSQKKSQRSNDPHSRRVSNASSSTGQSRVMTPSDDPKSPKDRKINLDKETGHSEPKLADTDSKPSKEDLNNKGFEENFPNLRHQEEPKMPKETKTARRKAAKAAKVAQNNQKKPDSGIEYSLEKLVMTADDGSSVEADFKVRVTKSDKISKKSPTTSAPETSVEAKFSENLAAAFVNDALLAAQKDLINIPEKKLKSNIQYTALVNEPTDSENGDYVPGSKVTYDYRPEADVANNESVAPIDHPELPIDDLPPDVPEDPTESELETSEPVATFERLSKPEVNDMFLRLKFLADRKARGGLQQFDKTRQSLIKTRLQKFQNIYTFRLRIAAAMIHICSSLAEDVNGMREKSVVKNLLSYIKEPVETDPDTMRGRNLDRLKDKVVDPSIKESQIAERGCRFIDLRICELEKSDPLHDQYTAISNRLFTLMLNQEPLLKIIGNNVDYRGYDEYL